MELFENPVFNLNVVKKMFDEIDHEIKDLRRIPKPKKKDDKEEEKNDDKKFNPDDLKNFDFSKMNFTDD